MRIAFRTDASQTIGLGHLRRSLALADAARRAGADTRFVMRDLGLDVAAEVAAAGHRLELLPAPIDGAAVTAGSPHAQWAGVDQGRDAAETAAALASWDPDWVVADCYAFDAGWHGDVRAALGCRIAVIDDLADRPVDADVVIDHNYAPDPGRKYAALVGPRTMVQAGPRFALLGPAFARAEPLAITDDVASIGVFMGGIDAENLSLTALAAIRDAGFRGPVEIATTSGNPHLGAVIEAAHADGEAAVLVDQPDLAGFFGRHQVQIGAGGGATWERCALGAPMILVCAAANQRAVIPALADAGAIVAAPAQPAALAVAIRALIGAPDTRRQLAQRARALVDRRGAERAALSLLGPTLSVRPAGLADSVMMHGWRDHPSTRAVSRQSASVAFADHEQWLRRTLADPRRHLFIGQVGSLPVGVVRFDRVDPDTFEVSFYLDPALHALGLGRHLLAAGEEMMGGQSNIIAEVLEDNPRSARLFETSGYEATAPGHYRKPGCATAGPEHAHEDR